MDSTDNPVEQVAPAADQAQAEQVVPTEEGTNAPEVVSDKEEKLYAGKFKSPEDLEHSYEESQRKLTQLAQEKADLERAQFQQAPEQGYAPETPQLDPDSAAAVRAMMRQERELDKAREFEVKHADELKDRLLAATTKDIMAEARSMNVYKDPEVALAEAKGLLDARIRPQIKEAQVAGVKEGEEISRQKGEMSAIGESQKPQEVDVDKLSAEEMRKYYNIPRI